MRVHEGPELVDMPSPSDESPEVTEEEMTCMVLDRFVGIPEQTYEEFLGTFTYLPHARTNCQVQTDDSQNQCPASKNVSVEKIPDKSEVEELEQLVIGEGEHVGSCHSLTHCRRVQVDNFLSSSDMGTNSDDEETQPNFLLYPGEADREVSTNDEPVIRSTCLDIQTSFREQTTIDERTDDDIQPFALDQSFDYDSVVLTPKFSAAELDFLKAKGNQKMKDEVGEEQNLKDL